MDIVDTVLARARASKHFLDYHFPPHPGDLRRLLHLLDIVGPTAILEFGSGWSTLVMAVWVARHPGAFLETLEADPIWYASTFQAICSLEDIADRFTTASHDVPQLRENAWEPIERWRLLFSPVSNGRYPHSLFYTYQCLDIPDFVYVDGPALWGRRVVTENAMTHVNNSRPMVFLVDGRMPAAASIYGHYTTDGNPYTWLHSMSTNCSLVYHEKYNHVGEWFRANTGAVQRKIEEGRVE